MDAITGKTRAHYNDVLFFLILIPFINALNYYLTYTSIPFSLHTLVTFLLDTAEGYLAWWCMRTVIVYLDKKVPYGPNPLKRILLQVIFSSAAALAVIIILTELSNMVATDAPVPVSFYKYDIFIFLIWFFVLNGIYIGLHYYNALRHMEKLRQEDKRLRSEGFPVKDGRQNRLLPYNAITGFFTDGEYTALVTTEAKKHLLDKSLDKIEQSLPGELFFRLNRQYIISRHAIQGFTREENGKLNVVLSAPAHFPAQVQVSRTKAPGFKTWFQPE